MECRPPLDLRVRTFRFAADILRFADQNSGVLPASRHLFLQLIRSATSVGANAEEAMGAYSRREFACRNGIALREAREARYWLRLISHNSMAPEQALSPLLAESNELVAILTAVVRRARENASSERSGTARARRRRDAGTA